MPELPEVETVRRGLQPVLEGARLAKVELRRSNLRFPFPDGFAGRLKGASVQSLWRRAKYMIADLDTGEALVMHLGMTGSFRIEEDDTAGRPGDSHLPRGKQVAHDHVVFHTDQGVRVVYNDPRRFGYMDLIDRAGLEHHRHFRDLGIEPLGNAFDAAHMAGRLASRQSPLKAALLDQRVIAGLGNIYVCEALWRTRLSPRRKAASLVRRGGKPTQRLARLVPAIRDVLNEAIEAGGSTLRDHRQADGALGYFQHNFAAYDREGEPCRHDDCDGEIARIVQAGRSTFYCPGCQR